MPAASSSPYAGFVVDDGILTASKFDGTVIADVQQGLSFSRHLRALPGRHVPATGREPIVPLVLGQSFAGGVVPPVIYAHEVSLSSDVSLVTLPSVPVCSDSSLGHGRDE